MNDTHNKLHKDISGDHEHLSDHRADPQPPRRNPRLVIGSLDYFEILMEQDEQG